MESISILGCGWLGMPLGASLIQDGYQVSGSTTSEGKESELRSHGIKPFRFKFNPSLEGNAGDFFNNDILVVSIPPRSRQNTGDYFLAQMSALINEIKKASLRKIIFISSTSVYSDNHSIVTEDDADPGSILSKAEIAFMSEEILRTTVIRFGGLVGPGRHPGKFLSGKIIDGANSPVNLIHQLDCIRIIKRIIELDRWGKIFNACADQHPEKSLFYNKACDQLGMPRPVFSGEKGSYKVVSNDRLKSDLDFSFCFPDPMKMTY